MAHINQNMICALTTCNANINAGIIHNGYMYCNDACRDTHQALVAAAVAAAAAAGLAVGPMAPAPAPVAAAPTAFTCPTCQNKYSDTKYGVHKDGIWFCSSYSCYRNYQYTKNYPAPPVNNGFLNMTSPYYTMLPLAVKAGPGGAFTMYF
jgi:hypothetical protein